MHKRHPMPNNNRPAWKAPVEPIYSLKNLLFLWAHINPKMFHSVRKFAHIYIERRCLSITIFCSVEGCVASPTREGGLALPFHFFKSRVHTAQMRSTCKPILSARSLQGTFCLALIPNSKHTNMFHTFSYFDLQPRCLAWGTSQNWA
jgi:hypothetical protein